MSDVHLTQLLINAADASKDLAPSPATDAMRQHLIALIQYLESKGLIDQGMWDLSGR